MTLSPDELFADLDLEPTPWDRWQATPASQKANKAVPPPIPDDDTDEQIEINLDSLEPIHVSEDDIITASLDGEPVVDAGYVPPWENNA